MIYYVAVLAGTFIYLLLQLNSVYNLPDFAFVKFFKTNWIPTLLNLIIGCVMVAFKADLINIYPITTISALMLGLGGQALIKKLTNVFDSKVETVVGL
jgi:hypothetical protein